MPTIIGFAALSYDSVQRERDHLLLDAERIGQNVLLSVERDLNAAESAAMALASSPSVAAGDLRAFHQQARSILRPEFPAFAFILSDGDARPLFNTRYAFGSKLPANANTDSIRKVFDSGLPATSNLYAGDTVQPYLFSLDVPVWRDGKVAYVLSAQVRPERLAKLLAEQRLPPRWTAQVFDDNNTFVARSLQGARFVGTLARPEVATAVRKTRSGMVDVLSREGVKMTALFQKSEVRGWYVTVGVPRDAATVTLSDSLTNVFLAVAALLVIGFATAWSIGGAIGSAVRALCAPAAALGRGEPLLMPALKIREAEEVGSALRQVEQELLRYRSGLETLVKERTAELERANALLETVYATAPVGLSLLDTQLRVVMVNEYLAAINAKPVSEHIGRTLPEILGPVGHDYEKAYRTVRDTGLPLPAVETSGPVLAEPGVDRHWIVSYHPVFGPDHVMVGISAVVLDISERKVLSQRLRDVNEQFRALYEMSGDAHMLLAQGAGFIGGNKAAAAIFGCASIEEFLTLSPVTTSPEFQPDGRRSDEKAQQFIRYALETGSHHFEWVHKRRDGTLFNADVLLTSLNIGGKGILQATVRDISERVAAEQALRATSERLERSERFIRTVTDNVPGMVGYWDIQLRCQFANRLYLEWFKRSEAEMIGKPIDEVLGPQLMAENAPYLREVLAGRATHFERELRSPDGETRHTWASYIPDFDERGRVRGFFVLISDISELKRSELRLQLLNEQLVQALDRAEMASSAKSEFLANMSHEIRTPMNAIMGLARLLEEGPLQRRERSYVAKIKMSTRSLMGILNDVLDFSKIEAGQLALEYTSFTLCRVLDSISVLVADNAWAKGVELVYAVAPDVPLTLVGDPMRLEQVLLNLIGNAIKFTERGEVVLTIGRRPDTAGSAGVVLDFAVRDTGIGIAPEHQARMFDAFSQGDSSTSRKYGGTGLGLAICRRLVVLMGGSLAVASELGKGAEFRFDLPFGAEAGAGGASLPDTPGMAGRRILIVDDNASSRAALAAQCLAFGWQVDTAGDGAGALEKLRAGRYDFMLLDTAMPELDGITVLTYARTDPAMAPGPRSALMVAENARERLANLDGDLRLDAILGKPVTPEALASALVELQSGKAPPAAAEQQQALAGRLTGIYVLLVEDNQINQEVANYILLHAGAAVDIAANGRIACSMLADAPTKYDAVLMDIQMPVMNGYEATEAIRNMGLTGLPIIAMTANAMEEDRAHAIAVGMNGHVAKPIDVDNLVTALNRVTSGGDARELRAPARPGYGGSGQSHMPDFAPPAHIPGIDLKTALPRFGGNFNNFATLFKRFEQSQGATLDEVRALLQSSDRHSAIQLVHRLRGVAANLGATNLASLAFDFEHALRGAGEAELAMRLTELDNALQEVLEAARAIALPAPPEAAPATGAPADPHGKLAELLALLQNNNLKAMAAFEQLRPALAGTIGAAEEAALADAIATLGFGTAAALVKDILNRKGSQ